MDDSPTTRANQVLDEYYKNADYEVNGSTTEAKKFIVACIRLLVVQDRSKPDTRAIERELNYARAWLHSNSSVSTGGSGVKHVDFRDFRD